MWRAFIDSSTNVNGIINSTITSISIHGSKIYVGGEFNDAGGIAVNNIAVWDINTNLWSALGSGVDAICRAISISPDGTKVYVGGEFSEAGGNPANYIAVWDVNTQTWSALGTGTGPGTGFVRSIAVSSDGNKIYANTSVWDVSTSTWTQFGTITGPSKSITTLKLNPDNSKLYVGGTFITVGGITVNNIAVWNIITSTWSALGSGLIPSSSTIDISSDGSKVYVGGNFTIAGGITVNNLALWDVTTESWSAIGTTNIAPITAIVLSPDNKYLYVNSTNPTISNYISVWDITTSTWSGLDGELNASCAYLDINSDGTKLYIGGTFTLAGGIVANSIVEYEIPLPPPPVSTFDLVYDFSIGTPPSFPFELTLPIVGGTVTSISWGDSTTTGLGVVSHVYTVAPSGPVTVAINWTADPDNSTFNYSSGEFIGSPYLIACTSFGTTGLTNANGMFANCMNLTSVPTTLPSSFENLSNMFLFNTLFNQDISGWNTTNVLTMFSMFLGAISFNQDISGWNTSNVNNLGNMFTTAAAFNQDISSWDVSNVINMNEMFLYAAAFNQNLGGWDISLVTTMEQMLGGSGLSIANYNATLTGWAALANSMSGVQPNVPFGAEGLTYSALAARNILTGAPNNWIITGDTYVPPPVPPPAPRICFKEGTKILCKINNSEVYIPIEYIEEDTLVKTYKHGYKKCKINIREKLVNTEEHSVNNLYYLPKSNHCKLFEDLYVTGSHSMLYDNLSIAENDAMNHLIKTYNTKFDIKINNKIDDKYKLIAYYDKSFTEVRKDITLYIHHIVLENEDKNVNYGIYANGALTESIDEINLTKYLIKNNLHHKKSSTFEYKKINKQIRYK
jgi:surface protein